MRTPDPIVMEYARRTGLGVQARSLASKAQCRQRDRLHQKRFALKAIESH
jgi:hypothetical protein